MTVIKTDGPEPEGTRIRLVKMGPDPCPIEPGATGTVTGGSPSCYGMPGQVWVKWDNGRSLILLAGIDQYEVIDG